MLPIDPKRAAERFSYDPSSGRLHWRNRNDGAVADRLNDRGYLVVSMDGRTYRAHRIVWAIFYEEAPSGEIDHIDRDRANNRIGNLRLVESHVENGRNCTLSRRNKSGYCGIRWFARTGRWHAFIVVEGKQVHLGYHLRIGDALAARKAAERRYGFMPTHGLAA